MAITTAEGVEQYRKTREMLNQIEYDIQQVDKGLGLEGNGIDIWARTLSSDERDEILNSLKRILEEKYEHVSAELEEMLK